MTDPRQISRIDHQNDDSDIAQTLADAFQDDPAFSWIIMDAVKRRIALPKLFRTIIRSDRKSGMVLSSPASEAATLWRSPGKAKAHMSEMIGYALPLLDALGFSLTRALILNEAIEAHHPSNNDYWYLHIAGVSPQHQGKGLGGSAIREGLARASAMGKSVLLETATPSNVPLYQRMGFSIRQEWDAPKGGPHFWTMSRNADAAT